MIRLMLLLVFLGAATASTTGGSFDARVWSFQVKWDRFLRHFWGCDKSDANRSTCNATLSTVNQKEYEAARKAAAELFDFKQE
jgi:hypothetical protein